MSGLQVRQPCSGRALPIELAQELVFRILGTLGVCPYKDLLRLFPGRITPFTLVTSFALSPLQWIYLSAFDSCHHGTLFCSLREVMKMLTFMALRNATVSEILHYCCHITPRQLLNPSISACLAGNNSFATQSQELTPFSLVLSLCFHLFLYHRGVSSICIALNLYILVPPS